MAKGAKARAAARKQRDKWKAKRWFTIRAPRNPWSFRVLGETLAEETDQLIGRKFEIMQNELDGDFSKMHVKVIFRVTEALGGDVLTEFVGHDVLKDHIRRQVRRHRGKIDDTVDVVSEDGYYIRFKPLVISRSRIKSSQKAEMRTRARDAILQIGATSTWIQLQKFVLDGTMESKVKEAVSTISPVRTVMIRRSQLLQSGVTVDEGPTLDEIHAEEKAASAASVEEVDVLAAAEASAELAEISESPVESETDEEAVIDSTPEETEEELDSSDTPDYASLTVAELKSLLKEAGKPVSGKKADLVARLQE
ncbi:MAG: SAP domain-containing protein [Candidatus Thalassarchaeaceae archaeon]|jgi:small subunit ribosomal protein S3Ae|nr:SAP domain-containing protein [Candidatus Thalassarchaeaceae archaeon]MDP6318023.1 SAP domain-containing protein [Candidatus Thalassarchaeaceae archaeon]DAC33004.1 MAG TPA: 30S ribosomal protein S3ae [Candidatus Poseidoniales archaeon]HIH80701.1 30S ribosomal protein S3ae [Candidatus Thalassarchaeaceae archaeon]HJM29720.1 SAP domain-containing protein [Candidatus Thalassarchaeaceae archaeon]|tara:strand:+ start:8418 stop:9344 length:927 start_codon:yes stop_codon:yes gene_type:complete